MTVDLLRAAEARIAELEASLSFSKMQTRETLGSLRLSSARIAELEAELDDRNDAALEEGRSTFWRMRAREAEARLAAVIALCDRLGGPDMSGGPNYVGKAIAREFRTAAAGETK